jgi:hypothetical protein
MGVEGPVFTIDGPAAGHPEMGDHRLTVIE